MTGDWVLQLTMCRLSNLPFACSIREPIRVDRDASELYGVDGNFCLLDDVEDCACLFCGTVYRRATHVHVPEVKWIAEEETIEPWCVNDGGIWRVGKRVRVFLGQRILSIERKTSDRHYRHFCSKRCSDSYDKYRFQWSRGHKPPLIVAIEKTAESRVKETQ
jgi:hypothetical protein